MEAEDRNIPLPDNAEQMEPSQLSETLFKKIMEA
jgi:hypothetical protein